MSFRRHTFPEVLDALLTKIVGGEAAETHPFPPDDKGPPFKHSLLRPNVVDIVSVYGSLNGDPHLFRKNTDYALQNGNTLQWAPKGGDLPDDGTLIYVNYTTQSAQPIVTDIQTGSVVRTLSESFGLEIAALYAQLQTVYDSGFVDTATGASLDKVVALLGIQRVRGGRAAGQIEFTRVQGSRGTITVPAGTRVITPDGKIEYETVEELTLNPGQDQGRVQARDLENNDPLPADSLTVLPVPIASIATVTNPSPTAIATQDETDPDLRVRAKTFLHGSERATTGALVQAFAEQGVPVDVTESPGLVEVTPHVDNLTPDLAQRLQKAKDAVRPVGVVVTIKGVEPPRRVNLKLRVTSVAGLVEQDLRAAQRAVRDKVQELFAKLPAKEDLPLNRLVGLVLSIPQITDVAIDSASTTVNGAGQNVLDAPAGKLRIAGFPTVLGDLQIVDPSLPTRLNVSIQGPPNAPLLNKNAIETALSAAVTYLNAVNASELAPGAPAGEAARRVLSFDKLLSIIPVPASAAAADLKTIDDQVAAGGAPALRTDAGLQGFKVQFVFTTSAGASQILSRSADPAYALQPFEQLTVSGVQVPG